jgi:hypothetical protein
VGGEVDLEGTFPLDAKYEKAAVGAQGVTQSLLHPIRRVGGYKEVLVFLKESN